MAFLGHQRCPDVDEIWLVEKGGFLTHHKSQVILVMIIVHKLPNVQS